MLTSLGNETHLGGTHLTSLARCLRCSFGYGHLLCQTPMRQVGLNKWCLASPPSCSHLHPVSIPARLIPSIPRDLASTPVFHLHGNSSPVNLRRTEIMSQFAVTHENVPKYRYIWIFRESETLCFLICFFPAHPQ